MKMFTTILLANTLQAILDHIEQHPEESRDLVEFKHNLTPLIQTLRTEGGIANWREVAKAA